MQTNKNQRAQAAPAKVSSALHNRLNMSIPIPIDAGKGNPSPVEKSKKRAADLKKAAGMASNKKRGALSTEERCAIETTIVDELNRTLAIIHTSSTYILVEKGGTEFVLDSKASLLTLYENKIVQELSGEDSRRPITKAQVWLKSPDRRTFNNIVFNPKIVGHYEGNYNIWKGFAITPAQGNCSLFWRYCQKLCFGV